MNLNNSVKLIPFRKKLRNKLTPQEVILWSRLKNSQLGYKFRRQYSVGNYILDFYCPKARLGIEIDGSQHFETKAIEYDTIRSQSLSKAGIQILRFTNTEVNTSIEQVMNFVLEALNHHPALPSTPPQQGGEENY